MVLSKCALRAHFYLSGFDLVLKVKCGSRVVDEVLKVVEVGELPLWLVKFMKCCLEAALLRRARRGKHSLAPEVEKTPGTWLLKYLLIPRFRRYS